MITAILSDGSSAVLDPKYGSSEAELHAKLSEGALTGSAVPLADAVLDTADGRKVAYGDVNVFETNDA